MSRRRDDRLLALRALLREYRAGCLALRGFDGPSFWNTAAYRELESRLIAALYRIMRPGWKSADEVEP